MKPQKILSLFNGMSCGKLALDIAGLPIDKYYSSEIDKYADQVAAVVTPEIVNMGDIERWEEWEIQGPDIILAGSPCQGFSFAGKRLNFEDPRSKLFFTFIDILKHYKPKYFLLENVKMVKEHNDIISRILGELYPEHIEQTEMFQEPRLEPILINSALVSAQNRERLYWTNIPGIVQPKDRGIYLRDIIESGEADRNKSHCVDANYFKVGNNQDTMKKTYFEKSRRQIIKCGILQKGRGFNKGGIKAQDGKTPTLTSNSWEHNNKLAYDDSESILTKWRKLTPRECGRLQTVPEPILDMILTCGVSNSQLYKMFGNGWTVDVIAHILGFIPEYKNQTNNQEPTK